MSYVAYTRSAANVSVVVVLTRCLIAGHSINTLSFIEENYKFSRENSNIFNMPWVPVSYCLCVGQTHLSTLQPVVHPAVSYHHLSTLSGACQSHSWGQNSLLTASCITSHTPHAIKLFDTAIL
jgi:hypothetical protein